MNLQLTQLMYGSARTRTHDIVTHVYVDPQSTSHLWPTFSPSKAAISLLGVSALRIIGPSELEGDLTLQNAGGPSKPSPLRVLDP